MYLALQKEKKFAVDKVRDYGLQLAKGVEYIHSLNVVHRDLKLGNLFLTSTNVLVVPGHPENRRLRPGHQAGPAVLERRERPGRHPELHRARDADRQPQLQDARHLGFRRDPADPRDRQAALRRSLGSAERRRHSPNAQVGQTQRSGVPRRLEPGPARPDQAVPHARLRGSSDDQRSPAARLFRAENREKGLAELERALGHRLAARTHVFRLAEDKADQQPEQPAVRGLNFERPDEYAGGYQRATRSTAGRRASRATCRPSRTTTA